MMTANLFSAQGIKTEITSLFLEEPTRRKTCKKCKKSVSIYMFRINKKYVGTDGLEREYRDSYCPKCRSKVSIKSPFRKTNRYLDYQKEFQKKYERKNRKLHKREV